MKKPLLEDKDYLTPSEAAALFNLSRRKFFRLCEEGGNGFMALYGDRRLIIKGEIEKYLAQPGVKEKLANGKPRTKKRLET